MSRKSPRSVLIIESRFYEDIADELARGAVEELEDRGIEYGIGAQILLDLGVREMMLLSNSPSRKIVGLEGYGLKVAGHRGLE